MQLLIELVGCLIISFKWFKMVNKDVQMENVVPLPCYYVVMSY